ncbi:hypothetical protein RB195_013154 [Necator americanus]|uniref:Peptidase M12A domain-containing protein n=1 Tax=Necator americanus TaxID=51031 RepID=A0ABR1DU89_NECAM
MNRPIVDGTYVYSDDRDASAAIRTFSRPAFTSCGFYSHRIEGTWSFAIRQIRGDAELVAIQDLLQISV